MGFAVRAGVASAVTGFSVALVDGAAAGAGSDAALFSSAGGGGGMSFFAFAVVIGSAVALAAVPLLLITVFTTTPRPIRTTRPPITPKTIKIDLLLFGTGTLPVVESGLFAWKVSGPNKTRAGPFAGFTTRACFTASFCGSKPVGTVMARGRIGESAISCGSLIAIARTSGRLLLGTA